MFDFRKTLTRASLCALLGFGAAATLPAQEAATADAATTAAAQGDLVPLELELPKAMFVGTPKDLRVPNLEPATTRKRPPLMVPKGVVNLALNKDVTSSDAMPIIGEFSQITDGDKEGSDGSYIELMPGKQWVQIDLGQTCELYAVVVWHFHAEGRVYNDIIVQVSDDKDFVEGVTTLFNNDHDNSSGMGVGRDRNYIETNEGRLIEARGAKARYVRLYSNGNSYNDMNHYTEVEVYGLPAQQ